MFPHFNLVLESSDLLKTLKANFSLDTNSAFVVSDSLKHQHQQDSSTRPTVDVYLRLHPSCQSVTHSKGTSSFSCFFFLKLN